MSEKRENIFTLQGEDLRHMILEACDYFEQHKESINDLNVFPVPDGDTGTNMSLTLKAAAGELLSVSSRSIGEVAGIAARSSLMGARGNSGVIFSQLFRGIARGLAGKDEANLYEVGRAFQYGIVYAYNAVSRPIEGTILTVAREIARGSREAIQSSLNFIGLFQIALESGKRALDRTPELLPALKEAGVVDAGGLGLIVFLEGCLQSLLKNASHGLETIELTQGSSLREPERRTPGNGGILRDEAAANLTEEFDERYPYCTELLIKGKELSVEKIRCELGRLGESLLVAGEKEIVKVHIHTADPGRILQICLQRGSIHDIKIDNMNDQFIKTRWGSRSGEENLQGAENPERTAGVAVPLLADQIGIVAISSGDGLTDIFTGMGAHKIIAGGQSMNPSVEDIVEAIQSLPSEMIIVLPNNNIRLAAEQAVKLVEKEVVVVDTRSLPQGLAALLAFDPAVSFSQNQAEMCQRARQVKTGEVTFAVRDARINNIQIKKDNIIGLSDGELLAQGKTVNGTTADLIKAMFTGEEEILSLFYGREVTSSQADQLVGKIEAEYPSLEVELHYGGQPLYYYLFSLE